MIRAARPSPVTIRRLPEGALNYEYDSITEQRTRVYSTKSDLRYRYDELGRLKTTTVIMHDRVTLYAPEVTTNTYTQLGSLENVYLPTGARTAYEYNRLNHSTNSTTRGSCWRRAS